MVAKDRKKKTRGIISGLNLNANLPEWGGGPAARYLILIAITILVGISLIMAFSASSNDAVIRQVQRDFALQSQEALTPEQAIEFELDYYAALEEALEEAQTGAVETADRDESTGFLGFLSTLFSSAYAAGFRHLLFAIVGAGIAIAIARVDYRRIVPYAIPVAWALLAMLIFLAVAGRPVLGSARWIDFGLFSFQPSEFAKPVLLLLIAAYCSWAKDSDDTGPARQKAQAALPIYRRDWVMPAILIGGSMLAIFASPDIGTVLIIGVGLFAAYVLSGWPWGRLVAGLGGLAVLFLGRVLLMDGGYQQRRIFEFITRWTDGVASHQTWQAELALGSGGILGLGPGLSRQKFRYLPEAHNDFIIAILGEELGLIGVFLVLIAFVFILWGGLHIASQAKDRLGTAIAGSATILIVFQALLNIFAVISLGPVTGKPLPFVTLGGSSMISTFMLVGLIFSVARYGHLTPPKMQLAGIFDGLPRRGGSRHVSTNNHDDESKRENKPEEHDGTGKRNIKRDIKRRPEKRIKRKVTEEKFKEVDDDDEDDLEWRWDSRTHLSGPRSRR